MPTIRIAGAIDRNEPDPQAPGDPLAMFIGWIGAAWTGEIPRSAKAAMIKVNTGRGAGDLAWGPHELVLRWLGDPPPVEISQAVYDYVRDGGPEYRRIVRVVESQPRSEAQASYRIALQARAS